MQKVVYHFWVRGQDGNPALYEVDYFHYSNPVGASCYAKVHSSERPCNCPEKAIQEERLAASLT